MDPKRRKRAKTSFGVPADGPQTPETGENVVWGAGRWTPSAGNRRNYRLGCWRMDLKRRKRAKPSSGVSADGPQAPETCENVVWGASRWTSNNESGRKCRLGCRRMDLKRRKQAKPSSGVPADGPQTPKTCENVVWGASGWTSNDENNVSGRIGAGGCGSPGRQDFFGGAWVVAMMLWARLMRCSANVRKSSRR